MPPEELGLGPAPRWRVAIFLSVLDVHVNRMPVDGTVTRIAYRHGKFLNASLDKASEDNERNAIAIRLPDGRDIAVVQIAGLIARRILCDVREGDRVPGRRPLRHHPLRQPHRPLPAARASRPWCVEGQTMIGGETVIAELAPPKFARERHRRTGSSGRPGFRGRLRRFRPRTRPRFKGPSFNRLIPNILTLLGLCAGLTAMRFALEAQWEQAAVAIVVAAAIDGLDGRLARLLKATCRFGAEFDSLSDFLCFGVAPALILYLWTLHDARGLGFAPCLLFAVCMALRLARFNASLGCAGPAADRAAAEARLCAEFLHRRAGAGRGGAGAVSAVRRPRCCRTGAGRRWPARCATRSSSALLLVVSGGLMVSTLPTWSFKNFKVPPSTCCRCCSASAPMSRCC